MTKELRDTVVVPCHRALNPTERGHAGLVKAIQAGRMKAAVVEEHA